MGRPPGICSLLLALAPSPTSIKGFVLTGQLPGTFLTDRPGKEIALYKLAAKLFESSELAFGFHSLRDDGAIT